MSPKTESWERVGFEKSDDSESSIDELESVEEFNRRLDVSSIHSSQHFNRMKELSVSESSERSSVFDSSVRSKSTAVSIGTSDGTKDLVLKWSTKVKLITIFNEYSAILHGKMPDDEQAILNKTNTLLQTLSGLPMRLKERISDGWNGLNEQNKLNEPNSAPADSNAAADSNAVADSNAASKPTNADQNTKMTGDLLLDLKWKARSKIVEALTTNQSFAIYNCRYISNESKRGLIEKNNELIQMLLGLRVRLVEKEKVGYLFAEEAPEKKDDKESLPDEASSKQSPGCLERPKPEDNAEMIARLATLGFSNSEMNATEKFEFTFEVNEFTRFCTDYRRYESKCFSWQNVNWALSVRIGTDANATESLEVYLVLKHYNSRPWPCKVNFILTLLGQAAGAESKVMRPLSHIYHQVEGYGFTKFCRLREVTSEENGFVLNDTIKIRFLGLKASAE